MVVFIDFNFFWWKNFVYLFFLNGNLKLLCVCLEQLVENCHWNSSVRWPLEIRTESYVCVYTHYIHTRAHTIDFSSRFDTLIRTACGSIRRAEDTMRHWGLNQQLKLRYFILFYWISIFSFVFLGAKIIIRYLYSGFANKPIDNTPNLVDVSCDYLDLKYYFSSNC